MTRPFLSLALLGTFAAGLLLAALGPGSVRLHEHGQSGLHAHSAKQLMAETHHVLAAWGGGEQATTARALFSAGQQVTPHFSVQGLHGSADGIYLGFSPARLTRSVSYSLPLSSIPVGAVETAGSGRLSPFANRGGVRVPPAQLKSRVVAILLMNHALLI